MSAPVFPWPCSRGSALDMAPRVLTAQFGENYAQRSPDGLNAMPESRPVEFADLSRETCDAIDAFLRARQGCESFSWCPPGQTTPRLWICPKWREVPGDGPRWKITADFVEVPA